MLKGGILYLDNPDGIATTIASPLRDIFFVLSIFQEIWRFELPESSYV